jgi:hypothetical protein
MANGAEPPNRTVFVLDQPDRTRTTVANGTRMVWRAHVCAGNGQRKPKDDARKAERQDAE